MTPIEQLQGAVLELDNRLNGLAQNVNYKADQSQLENLTRRVAYLEAGVRGIMGNMQTLVDKIRALKGGR